MKNTNESGRSLVEMLAVIGIIGIIGMGAVAGVRFALVSGGSIRVQNDVEAVVQGVQELCSWSPNYSDCGLNTQLAKDNDIITNESGITVSVGSPDTTFLVTVSGVSQRVCRRLLNPLYTQWNKGLVKSIIPRSGHDEWAVSELTESHWRSTSQPCAVGDNTMQFRAE